MNKGGPGVQPWKKKRDWKWCNQSYSGGFFWGGGGIWSNSVFFRSSWQLCYPGAGSLHDCPVSLSLALCNAFLENTVAGRLAGGKGNGQGWARI